jgi:hypothetical protein
MPDEMIPYIRLFDLFTSTTRPQICICSFEDMLVSSFTSPFISNDIQRSFFRSLGGLGIEIDIVSNTEGGYPDSGYPLDSLEARRALLP